MPPVAVLMTEVCVEGMGGALGVGILGIIEEGFEGRTDRVVVVGVTGQQ